MHRIVVNVIECRPEMPVRFHPGLDAVKPNLPPTSIILAIPVESRPPVELANVTKLKLELQLNSNRRFDGRVRVVADQLEILEPEIVDVPHSRIEPHRRQRPR